MTAAVSAVHRGYRLIAKACSAHSGLHGADLVIEQPGRAPETFAALDYFFDEEQALRYATRWGRVWVDLNARGLRHA